MERTDEQLLQEFVSGRTEALGDLASRHERALLGLCAGLLGGSRERAGDAVQETWVRVIRFAHKFKGRSSVRTWLYRIAINQCREMRWGARPPVALNGKPPVEPAAGPPDPDGALRAAVAALDETRRLVVLLCYHAALTHESAAEILGIPLGTLKSRLNAALTDLRRTLKEEAVR